MEPLEHEIVAWLASRPRKQSCVQVGIGDDMATLNLPAGPVLVSTDMLLDGVHFESSKHDGALIGGKAMRCAISDCAATAVRPVAATVSMALPRTFSLSDVQRMVGGIFQVADEFDVAIVGGDTTRWDHPLAIDVGISAVPYEGVRPVLRSGAVKGDTLYVTGCLGGSRLGHHLTFTPRVREARALAEWLDGRLHAMLDISDGLSLDLWRMCESSNVGAIIDERMLETVTGPDVRRVSTESGHPALEHVLSDGEDFELLLSVAGSVVDPPVPLFPIGEIIDNGLSIRRDDGRIEPLEPKGFLH